MSGAVLGNCCEISVKSNSFSFLCVCLGGTSNNRTEETVYGKRDGTMPGIAIISRNSGNLFKQTKGWKTGTIHSVPMLARNSMYKPDMATWQTHKQDSR